MGVSLKWLLRCSKSNQQQNNEALEQRLPYLPEKNQDAREKPNCSESSDLSLADKCCCVLSQTFPLGFELGSALDRSKFATSFLAGFAQNLPFSFEYNCDIEAFESLLVGCGLVVSGKKELAGGQSPICKVFAVSESTKQFVVDFVKQLFDSGIRIACFAALFENYYETLSAHHIYTKELLIAAVKELYPASSSSSFCVFYDDAMVNKNEENLRIADAIIHNEWLAFCGSDGIKECFGTLIKNEVLRAFAGEIICNCSVLKKRLPGLDEKSIVAVLENSKLFAACGSNSDDAFVVVSKMKVGDIKLQQIELYLNEQLSRQGSIAVKDLEEKFPELINKSLDSTVSREAFLGAFFSLNFNGKFLIKGHTVQEANEKKSYTEKLKAFCLSQESFTLCELKTCEAQVAGKSRYLSLVAAQDTCIQVNAEMFVHPKSIEFEVDIIDDAINLVFVGNTMSLWDLYRAVDLPKLSGYDWNINLFWSYCKLVSRMFVLYFPANNSYGIGAVVRRGVKIKNYYELVARRALEEQIPDNVQAVTQYIVDRHFYKNALAATIRNILQSMHRQLGNRDK